MAPRLGTPGKLVPALAVWAALAGCAAPVPEQTARWQAATPEVESVYRRALAELGPHKYTGAFIPAVVIDNPPDPVIKPARLLPDGLAPAVPPPSWHAVAWSRLPGTQPTQATEAAQRPAPRARPEPSPAAVPASVPPPQATAAAEDAATPGGTVSELRFGALKHAIAFGHTAKEGGWDGNLEVLFHSPGFLRLLWSPRPTVGLTINGSQADTDFLYTGLTWEWAPADWFFAGLGLGLSVHDGMLDNSKIAGKERFNRREFGCRVLFRESVEVGTRFAARHSLSLMWAHHSHGSLCHEENEGIDNAGLRYGIRL